MAEKLRVEHIVKSYPGVASVNAGSFALTEARCPPCPVRTARASPR